MTAALDIPALTLRWMTRLEGDGYPVGTVRKIRLSTRMTRSLGITRERRNAGGDKEYSLSFSMALTQMPEKYADVAIVHELIHTFPDCMNHGLGFKNWGVLLHERYSLCCEISRISPPEMTGAFNSTAFITTKKQQKKKKKRRHKRRRRLFFPFFN